ncbi:hypothetical protein Tco_0568258 [Tanacetum coccineum]
MPVVLVQMKELVLHQGMMHDDVDNDDDEKFKMMMIHEVDETVQEVDEEEQTNQMTDGDVFVLQSSQS